MLLHPTLKRTLPATLALLITAGCATGPSQEEIAAAQIETANQLIASGDYTAGAEEFLKLADAAPALLKDETPSNLKQVYQLTAAEAYIQAGDSLNARKTLALIDVDVLDQSLSNRYHLITAHIAEIDQQPEQVIQALSQIDLAAASPMSKKQILAMQISAFETLESSLEAIQARTLIDPLLESELEQDTNRRTIWTTIDQFDSEQFAQTERNIHPQLTGWLELNLIARESIFDTSLFADKVAEWRLHYPDHAAESPVLRELFTKSEVLGKKISTIALLLPNTGRFAQAGAAVRDGFLSAWYGENDQLEQPMVHVYQADASNILEVYQRAVDEGVDLVVGPLEKEAVKMLLSLSELPVKTLALNHLSTEELAEFSHHIDANHFYQFGLSPEQEAAQVAEKAWAEGFRQALAITPEDAWGDRLFTAFQEKYEALGGVIVDQQKFSTTEVDFSAAVIKLLDIDDSKERYNELTNELNRRIKFEPRPRKDMDFIFMAARPTQARQIRPQLLFHRASGIPVLTTSHAFGLPPHGEPDLDLEGVIIGDMPWMIKNQIIDPATPLAMQQNWPDNNAAFLRLFALGIDAYKVIPQLGRLRMQIGGKFEGETGNLYLNEHAQIQRDLAWAKFLRGKPEFLDSQYQNTQTALPDSESEEPTNK